jgi:hypothetical protein
MSLGSIVYIGLLVGICLYFVNGVVHRICQCIEKCNAAEWRANVEKYKLYLDYGKEVGGTSDQSDETSETEL